MWLLWLIRVLRQALAAAAVVPNVDAPNLTAEAVVDGASDVTSVAAVAVMATVICLAAVIVALTHRAVEVVMTGVAVVTIMGAEVGVADEAGLFAM